MGQKDDVSEPAWVNQGLVRKTPYTEDELDRLVADFVRGLVAQEWQTIKAKCGGEDSARVRLRAGIIKRDPNNLANIDPEGPIH